MSKKNPLAEAIGEAGGSRTRIRPIEQQSAAISETSGYVAPSRAGTVPVTGHFPKDVRDQLKILAIQEGTTLQGIMAEAFNDLFAKHGKPEIAPKPSNK